MKTIALTWELGAGLGHVAHLTPIAEMAVEAGHRVAFVVRDPTKFGPYMPEGSKLYQAPVSTCSSTMYIEPARSFTHVLHNTGFDEQEGLTSRVRAFKAIFDEIKPDVIIGNHAPTSLVAARAAGIPFGTVGTGFCVPPPVEPIPDIRPWMELDLPQFKRYEGGVLERTNHTLKELGSEPIEKVADIFGDPCVNYHTVYPELDVYGPRDNVHYCRGWQFINGNKPDWPTPRPGGKLIFAYLKKNAFLRTILQHFAQTPHAYLVYIAGTMEHERRQMSNDHIRVTSTPVSIEEVGKECDLAILASGPGTIAGIWLAGKPVLIIPQYFEQEFTGNRANESGAAMVCQAAEIPKLMHFVKVLTEKGKYTKAAQAFADKYSDFSKTPEPLIDFWPHFSKTFGL